MNKKFYQIKKLEGITSVYFTIKSQDTNQNKKFEINADDFLCLNNVLIDYTINKYIFYAKEIELVKIEKYVLELSLKDEPNNFKKIIPIPIRSFFKNGYDDFYNKLMEQNPNCKVEVFQFYKNGK